jgi:hypothetical protein
VNQKRVSVSRKVVNEVPEINAEENGEKAKIVDNSKNGITIEIVKQKDGKEVIEKFEARSAEELEERITIAMLARCDARQTLECRNELRSRCAAGHVGNRGDLVVR